MIGALEAGGTKMVMGVYMRPGELIDSVSIPTRGAEETLSEIIAYFKAHSVSALGIGSFGPIELDESSPRYGYITSTPKAGWRDFPLLPRLRDALGVPCLIDTDVNAAALAESRLGAARGLNSAVYITVGTGIGGGVVIGGACVHGLVHPEIGHMLLRPALTDTMPEGVCPYHNGCLEGLASGPALGARVKGRAEDIPDDDPVIRLEAEYLAQMCVNLIMTLSPERILLGGGVMKRGALFPMIREETKRLLGGYVQSDMVLERIDEYIVPPAMYPLSGLAGAYLLGLEALSR